MNIHPFLSRNCRMSPSLCCRSVTVNKESRRRWMHQLCQVNRYGRCCRVLLDGLGLRGRRVLMLMLRRRRGGLLSWQLMLKDAR